jgi:hypothetical protein
MYLNYLALKLKIESFKDGCQLYQMEKNEKEKENQ